MIDYQSFAIKHYQRFMPAPIDSLFERKGLMLNQ